MSPVTGILETRVCAVCERTLLTGERSTRYAPDGETFVDVCPLCQEDAVEQGWLREGSPTTPIVAEDRPRRGFLSGLFSRKPAAEEPVAPEPILRRLSERELAMVEAAELFNQTPFRRTIAGIARSLGPPKASVVPLGGVNTEVVVTIAWDLSWYQYRVAPDSAQPVRLEERGHEVRELDAAYREWNARLDEDGRLVPEIERL